MKVILKEDIKNIGKKDDVVNVADGYAKNALIPQGKAVAATKDEIAKLQREKEKEHDLLVKDANKWFEVKKHLESLVITLEGKANDGVLVEKFSRKNILQEINKKSSTKIEKNQLPKDYLFGLGTNSYIVNLYPNVDALVKIEIKEKIDGK